jgi:hypothetical protein
MAEQPASSNELKKNPYCVQDFAYKKFTAVTNILFQEQAYFWQVFAGFGALNAGLFVLAESKLTNFALIGCGGIILSILWATSQLISWRYVHRHKDQYYFLAKEVMQIDIVHLPFNRIFSTRVIAILTSLVVLIIWIALVFCPNPKLFDWPCVLQCL